MYGPYRTVPLCCSIPLPLFPCWGVGFPHGLPSFRKKSAPACILCGPQFLQEMSIWFNEGSSKGCRWGMSAWVPGAPPSPPPLTMMFPLLCLTLFVPLSLSLFCLFLGASCPWLSGPAVGLLEPAVSGMGQPLASSHRGHPAALSPPATSLFTCTQYTHERVIYHKMNKCKMTNLTWSKGGLNFVSVQHETYFKSEFLAQSYLDREVPVYGTW